MIGRPIDRRVILRSGLAALALAGHAMPVVAAPPPDKTFTIAVIPDTQNYIDYTHQKAEGFPFDAQDIFHAQTQYIADHATPAGGDIVFATSVGDIWQHESLAMDPAHAARGFKAVRAEIYEKMGFVPTPKIHTIEIPAVRKGYGRIAEKIPFSAVPGNHDYDSQWVDSYHPPLEHITPKDPRTQGMVHVGGLTNFASVFGPQTPFFKGKPWYVASHDGGADSAQIFAAGGYRFLHIGLQFDAPNASLEWARSIIRRYPGLPTIISTHDYMDTAGNRLPNPTVDNHAVDPQDNNPEMIWQKLIREEDQIFLVLCGHEHGAAYRVDPNASGHKVHQLLADYQSRAQTAIDAGMKIDGSFIGIGDGWMRLMAFDFASAVPEIHVRTYSAHYKAFSTDLTTYAQWYKAQEHPQLSDADFGALDDFVIRLEDFRARFDRTAKSPN